MPVTLPPFALSTPRFPFRHLATSIGRAPLGGAREVAMACYMTARVLDSVTWQSASPEATAAGHARAAAARAWLGALALGAGFRSSVTGALDAIGTPSAATRLRAMAGLAHGTLEPAAHGELEALADRLERLVDSAC